MLKLPENDRKRIAIFTTDDKIWALPVWAKTIPEFEVDYEVIGIYLFPEHFKKMKGTEIPSFYLKTFGVWNFILLGLYALKTAALALFSRTNSWKSLSVTHGLQLNKGDTPNSMEVRTWLKENNIDIVFIFLNDILKSDTLAAATYGFINKHAEPARWYRNDFTERETDRMGRGYFFRDYG